MRHPAPAQPFHELSGLDLRVKIVDIGANPIDGAPPYAPLLRAGMADIVGFEPNPQALARLQDMKGPNETYLPHAIGDGGTHLLHFCQAPGMTSLFEPDMATLALFHGFPDWGRVMSSELVQTVRLDDIPETEGADMLKLDIQGAELMALRHGETRLSGAVVAQVEVEFVPLYVDQPLFAEVDAFMRARGFMLHRFIGPVSRVVRPLAIEGDLYAGLGQAVWADAIFMRDITRLDRIDDRQLIAMATILHDCYGSIDIAMLLVTEHDRRTGSDAGSTYLSSLRRSWFTPSVAA